MPARLLPERLAAGIQFAENFNERRRSSFRARAARPGIHFALIVAARWIPGLRPGGRISDAQSRIGE
jgi:hypothetical protein